MPMQAIHCLLHGRRVLLQKCLRNCSQDVRMMTLVACQVRASPLLAIATLKQYTML